MNVSAIASMVVIGNPKIDPPIVTQGTISLKSKYKRGDGCMHIQHIFSVLTPKRYLPEFLRPEKYIIEFDHYYDIYDYWCLWQRYPPKLEPTGLMTCAISPTVLTNVIDLWSLKEKMK